MYILYNYVYNCIMCTRCRLSILFPAKLRFVSVSRVTASARMQYITI